MATFWEKGIFMHSFYQIKSVRKRIILFDVCKINVNRRVQSLNTSLRYITNHKRRASQYFKHSEILILHVM